MNPGLFGHEVTMLTTIQPQRSLGNELSNSSIYLLKPEGTGQVIVNSHNKGINKVTKLFIACPRPEKDPPPKKGFERKRKETKKRAFDQYMKS